MDGFTYTDIFATKGMEYIIIIVFLIILIPFWIIMNKQSRIAKQIHRVIGVLTANLLRIPQGMFYSKNHTWAFLAKSGNAKIGLDDFLLQIVGDVNVSHLKFPGEKIRKGEVLAEIDQNGKRLRITSPVSGEIVNVNNSIKESPEILQEDPYGKGWIYAIKPSDWKSETQSYYLGGEASNWITNELVRFKDFLSVSLGKYSSEPSLVTFQEGGELRQNILSELDDKIWEDFQESFLNK
jgi:glycine cleavage system H protein